MYRRTMELMLINCVFIKLYDFPKHFEKNKRGYHHIKSLIIINTVIETSYIFRTYYLELIFLNFPLLLQWIS